MSTPSFELANSLIVAAVRLTRRLRTEDRTAKLSGPQASALAAIVFARRIRLSDLAEVEQVRGPTISELVNGLEAMNLVRRIPDGNDRRVSRVEATAKGRKLLADGQQRRVAPLAAKLEALDEKDRLALARAAQLMADFAND